ncbi:sodium/potassium-transporting ATPase subunit alpha-like isoform X2 [Uloborus diversus]|uniref:sodium/potassium-transporting ATPase subunit alpha-like isoform X2 n=1 Tax=Uloborus diversus TaxID=327109 RepID=UPI002408F955|nr:sodium/potassium-transporting ATPase subunit alpha-like isoform X2 [Uloborus diversus]
MRQFPDRIADEIILLTSDVKSVAKDTARRVGIISPESETLDELSHRLNISVDEIEPGVVKAIVVTGLRLTVMDAEELDELIQSYEEIVFAEIKPNQKVLIVESCKRMRMVVATTGTDILDCPAVEKADIGRVVFDNIQKTICYNLASNLPEFLPLMLVVTCQIPLPLGATFILLIDLCVSMLPTLSLIYEKQESDIMRRRPIDPYSDRMLDNRIVNKSLLQIGIPVTLAGLYVYFVVMAENGFMPEDLLGIRNSWNSEAVNDLTDSFNQEWTYTSRKALEYTCQTAFFMTIVLAQLFDLIMCRSWRDSLQKRGICNRVMILSVLFEIFLAVILCYVPGMWRILHIYPLKFLWWLPGLPFSVLTLGYDELRKFLIRHSEENSWLERET